MSHETDLFDSYGLNRIGGSTSARTYAPISISSLADAAQQDNRASTPWKRAEWIFATDAVGNRTVGEILAKWRELVNKDRSVPKIQKLILKENDGSYSAYNYRGDPLIQNGSFADILASYLYKNTDERNVEQRIFFGAPGTGKSYGLRKIFADNTQLETDFCAFMEQDPGLAANSVPDYISYYRNLYNYTGRSLFDYVEKMELDVLSVRFNEVWDDHWTSVINKYKSFLDERLFRTVFHPDYDYAQFVGCYKPCQQGGQIGYSFREQIFAKAYLASWISYLRCPERPLPIFLVIEEINRGNCAQIFGDLFQLLDRDDAGFSRYEIDPDEDFSKWLLGKNIQGMPTKLRLPPNFYILATMNTSDQSLFPMDSAFKRRFDWEYVPIKYERDESCGNSWNADQFIIDLDGNARYKWVEFLKAVNADIKNATLSEDKQMGEFFVKPKNNVIDLDMFRSKVLFYLWDSVYKEESSRDKIFHFPKRENSEDKVSFQTFFEGTKDDQISLIKKVFTNLQVPVLPSNVATAADATAAVPEEGAAAVTAAVEEPAAAVAEEAPDVPAEGAEA